LQISDYYHDLVTLYIARQKQQQKQQLLLLSDSDRKRRRNRKRKSIYPTASKLSIT
jgi:hypothetical protein